MRLLKRLICFLLLIGSLSSFNSVGLAQGNVLPPELSQSSSLSEILAWLDKNSFPQARIGLNAAFDSDSSLAEANYQVYETVVFTQGFKLSKAEGCYLTVRNDSTKLLTLGTNSDIGGHHPLEQFWKTHARSPADLYLRLDRLNPDGGKGPHLYSKNPKFTEAMGLWETEFKKKSGRSPDVILVKVFDSPSLASTEQMYGESVTFTFDSKEASERFNAAFRRAIGLCTTK